MRPPASKTKPKASFTGWCATATAVMRIVPSSHTVPGAISTTSTSKAAVEGRSSWAMRALRSASHSAIVPSTKRRVPRGPRMRCGRARPWCQLDMMNW